MKVVIIGYGHAGRAYVSACRNLSAITEIFVVDVNQAVRSDVPHGVNFATRLPPCRFDLAIIATPPSTHLSVLESVIEKAKRFILEKPFAVAAEDLNSLFNLATIGSIFFSIHARYGEEVLMGRRTIQPLLPMSEIKVSQLYCDPYWPNGPKNLGGPFWDSIFNALGVVNAIFDDIKLSEIEVKADLDNFLDIEAQGTCQEGVLQYRLCVDWRRALNLKVTEVTDPGRHNGVLINHSQQCVSALSGLTFEHYPFSDARLTAHYKSVVHECITTDSLLENNRMARLISDQVLQIEALR
ncbi:Gfo/Idh/MocA family oxidoreductase [bacterium]|nr:Gfo/Idh/MocA family oxidoreductase [bacterium]